MKTLLEYLSWRVRRRHLVRLHHAHMTESLEGILVGVWGDHYILRVPKLLESEERTVSLDAREVRVPRPHVLFVEVLS